MLPAARSYERLAGAAVGTMLGDALGMPAEGMDPAAIDARFGRLAELRSGRLPAGSYTDDSQMMIAILETLAERERLDPAFLAGRFLANFKPWRGYGGRIHGVMARLAAGVAWDQAGADSFGNGGAMRVGVLGVFHADDEAALLKATLDQCRVTHHHPQALAGAAAQALAVGLACRLGAAGAVPVAAEFVAHLVERIAPLDAHMAQRLGQLPALARGDSDATRRALVAAYARDVRAAEAAPPAIGAFLAADSARAAVELAVSLGGDADTIGAMAGALAGAYWGLAAWPTAWLAGVENGPAGRDRVLELCRRIIPPKAVDETAPGC